MRPAGIHGTIKDSEETMIFAFGQFELDTRVYELRHEGRVRPVEPQVFDLLVYLAANRDRVIGREELLEKLWPDRFVSETTLTSRLKEARKAVGDSGRAQSVIRTYHGRGYRFVAMVEDRDDPSPYSFTPASGDYVVRASPPVAAAEAVRARRADFVGRASELSRLDAALKRALAGTRQIVFVTGEGGAGKTTLVETFLAGRSDATLLVARGQCIEHRGSGEPYMPLIDALARICRADDRGDILDLLRRNAPSWIVQMPWVVSDEELTMLKARSGSPGERMLRELGMAVERLTAELPLLVVLEDLHWSDLATLEAIDLLARQSEPARLLLIGTYRPSDVKAARHPVYAISQELRARGLCDVVPLPLLVPKELDEYLSRRFADASFTHDLAPILHARTAGNPLFIGNMVDSWIARGLITQQDGVWSLQTSLGRLETDVPDSLQHLIEKQFAELDAERQRILETASVVGREFSVALIAATLPADDDEIERQLELLAREGRFIGGAGTEQWGDGTFSSRFAFTHDLYVDVLYDNIAEARRTRIHQQVGLTLERAWPGRESDHAAELALHFQRAHDRDRAARYLQLAAEQSIQRSAYREAVVHLNTALEVLERPGQSPEQLRTELAIRSKLAPALIATRGWADPEAEANYLRAADVARHLGDVTTLSQMLYGMANMFEYRGDYGTAERIARERIELDGDASLVSIVESHELLACSMLHQGRYQEALEYGRRALAACDEPRPVDLGQIVLLVQAHGWTSGALVFAGFADEALEHNRQAARIARQAGDDLAIASAAIQAAFVRFYRREPEESRVLAEAGSAIARERRFPFLVACARILIGWWMSQCDRHEEAIREIRAGLRTAISIGARMDLPLFLAMLSEALARSGAQKEALEAIDEALAMVDRNRSFFYVPELHRMRGELLLHRGDRDCALEALRRALTLADEQNSPLFGLRAAASLFSAGAGNGAPERLRAIVDSFEQGRDMRDVREAMDLLR